MLQQKHGESRDVLLAVLLLHDPGLANMSP